MPKHQAPALVLIASLLAGSLFADRVIASQPSEPASAQAPLAPVALVTTITVNTPIDDYAANGLCSLREAVESARQFTGIGGCTLQGVSHIIAVQLPAGTFTLTRTGTITGGSLDLSGSISVNGAGITQTIIKQTVGAERVVEAVTGTITLRNLAVTGGQAGDGGGILNNATLTLETVRVFSNTATTGGGMYNVAGHKATIRSSEFDGNRANSGGGLRNAGILDMQASAIFSNTAQSHGGLSNAGQATLVNSSVISNTAESGLAGGIFNDNAQLALFSVTIAANRSNNTGAGLQLSDAGSANVVLQNTIVAQNRRLNGDVSDCAGVGGQALYSLIGVQGCGFRALFENQVGSATVPVTPLFGALSTTVTGLAFLPLLPASPAINRGDPAGCPGAGGAPLAVDQVGAPRAASGRCDAGAVEFGGVPVLPSTPTPVPTATPVPSSPIAVNTFTDDSDSAGLCTLREAVEAVRGGVSFGQCSLGAGPRHVVQLLAGTYVLTRPEAVLGGDLELNGNIEIAGAGMTLTTISQARLNSRVIQVQGGQAMFRDLTISSGSSATTLAGAGIEDLGNLTLRRVRMSANTTQGSGGALHVAAGASAVLDDVVLHGNSGANGGAISNEGVLNVHQASIYDNSGASAAGLLNSGTAALANTSIISNVASSTGGILSTATGRLTLSNVTVARNVAASNSGGMKIDAAGQITIMNSIIAENKLTNGARADCDSSATQGDVEIMLFSLLGTSNAFCQPDFGFFNLIGGSVPVTPNFAALDTAFSPNLPLLVNSPVINLGDPNGCRDSFGTTLQTDQLATPRPQGTRCDMGAVEYTGLQPTPTPIPTPTPVSFSTYLPMTVR